MYGPVLSAIHRSTHAPANQNIPKVSQRIRREITHEQSTKVSCYLYMDDFR